MTSPAGYAFAGTTMTVLVPGPETGGAFALLHVVKPSGSSTPPHSHERDAEVVYTLSGAVKADTEGRVLPVAEGEAFMLPPGRPHRLFNDTGRIARELLLCVPAGFEDFVTEAGTPTEPFADPWAMTGADRQRLAAAAPRHGIRLLHSTEPDGPAREIPAHPVEAWDVLGARLEVLVRLGEGDDDLVLLRSTIPGGASVPLHGHADPECFFVVEGRLEIFRERPVPGWATLGPDQAAYMPPDVRHAVRNPGRAAARILMVTTVRMARFFATAGTTPEAAKPRRPGEDDLHAFLCHAAAYGYALAKPEENAAIGLTTHA